ncbi:response regulator transcription factor [Falsiroseomonas sp.]|uniref:response regulator transcription factor n=1 Tax=Falsiroseomonas sp. TaxID=2870721 RepID=UPI00356A0AD9
MKKIMVVEDEIVVAMSVEMVLEAEGYAVVLATDGREGLRLAHDEQPDLILTDLMMPRMDGAAMAARLREQQVRTPIVMMTWIAEDRLPQARRAFHDAFLTKPFSDEQLLAVVRRLLGPA